CVSGMSSYSPTSARLKIRKSGPRMDLTSESLCSLLEANSILVMNVCERNLINEVGIGGDTRRSSCRSVSQDRRYNKPGVRYCARHRYRDVKYDVLLEDLALGEFALLDHRPEYREQAHLVVQRDHRVGVRERPCAGLVNSHPH